MFKLSTTARLETIDELRANDLGEEIELPQLVVVGDQSSGKSSALEILTGIPFPRNHGLCTRYATEITSCRGDVESMTVSIRPHPQDSDSAHRKSMRDFAVKFDPSQDFNTWFAHVIKEVRQ